MIKHIKSKTGGKIREIKKEFSWFLLKYNSHNATRKLAESIDFIKKNKKWNDEEYRYFNSIDELRDQYLNSNQTVLVKDFGAGNSAAIRTAKEMEKGVDSEKSISEICKSAASPEQWGKLIFKIIREVKPKNVLELGTSLGISAAYQISALKLNDSGRFTTIEGSAEIAEIAWQNLGKIGFSNFRVNTGKFMDVLPKVLNTEEPIDLVFIDGHHDKTATKEYFEILYPNLEKNAILIFDDINWSGGMREIWQEIYNDTRINVSFDLNKWGICQIDKNKEGDKLQHFKMNL